MSYLISSINAPAAYYIPGECCVGRQFIIRGKVDYRAERFYINLQEDNDNVAFHFNPRQWGNLVVRNSKVGGQWQNEERDIPCFPFREGRTFQIKIEVAPEAFIVYVNGRHFINFKHRMDLARIKYLFLSEGAEYYDATFQNKHTVPFTMEIPGGMKVGKAFRLRGACTDSDGFSMNFVNNSKCSHYMFHFNPRPRQDCVVRNANFGGWGVEERGQDCFPFGAGQYFDSLFVATEEGYVVGTIEDRRLTVNSISANSCPDGICKHFEPRLGLTKRQSGHGSKLFDTLLVYVNDKLFCTFKHRCNVNDAKFISVRGDVDVADIEYLEPQDDVVKSIPSGLEKGDIVSFRGYFKQAGERFSVNLVNGRDNDSDIAFHFNPRRGARQVVMNNRINGNWQREERQALPEAFIDNKPFEIKFIIKRGKFKVFINDMMYCEFVARGKLEDIKGIMVAGQAYIYSVSLMRKLETPYTEKIPGGLHANDWIAIKGTPKKARGRFAINLQCGESDESDIALHFNPRFGERTVVRNNRVGGSWQAEERQSDGFPFEKRDAFEICMNVKVDRFVIFVNGDRFAEFLHRVSIERISHINLWGIADLFEPEFTK